jgi:hypothetical protein
MRPALCEHDACFVKYGIRKTPRQGGEILTYGEVGSDRPFATGWARRNCPGAYSPTLEVGGPAADCGGVGRVLSVAAAGRTNLLQMRMSDWGPSPKNPVNYSTVFADSHGQSKSNADRLPYRTTSRSHVARLTLRRYAVDSAQSVREGSG